jgi:hypothetical protein
MADAKAHNREYCGVRTIAEHFVGNVNVVDLRTYWLSVV